VTFDLGADGSVPGQPSPEGAEGRAGAAGAPRSGESTAADERYRALVQHGFDMVAVVVPPDMRAVYLSPSFERVLGYPLEYLEPPRPEIIHPDDVERVVAAYAEAFAAAPGTQVALLFRMRRTDGEYRTIEARLTNRLDDPAINGIVSNGRDVTDAIAALEQLTRSEQRYRALSEHSSDLVAIFDERLALQYASGSHRTVLGHDWMGLDEDARAALVHPDDLVPRLIEPMLRVRAQAGATETTTFRIRHADGRWRHLEAIVANWLANPAVAGIVVTSRDVTDRVEAESALRAEKERFSSLVRHSTDVVAVIAPDGELLYVSPSLEAVYGYRPEEVVGARGMPVPVHDDDSELLRRALESVAVTHGRRTQVVCRLRHRDDRDRWSEIDVCNLTDEPSVGGTVVHMRDITDRKLAEEELAHKALHDELTGLPNRALLRDRLDHALTRAARTGQRAIVLFLDLDHFKDVNDSLGHDVGDRLIVAVGERLLRRVRASDTVARLGGDEFVVLLEDVTVEDAALDVAQSILEAMREPIDVDGRELFATASIGVAVSGAPSSATSLLRDADAAMYEAKKRGRDCLQIFDDSVRARVVHRVELESDLRRALDRGELRLVYQPAYELSTMRPTGVEALLRWHHPERGVVAPGDFVPLAEQSGLIVPIGEWVLDAACAQAAAWDRALPDPDRTVWVNVSARQLGRPDFAHLVARALARHDLDPSRLGLEITESMLIEEAEEAGTELREVEALGVRLAIDDFGTGYSSLSYLRRYKVDVLKLDRTFVRDLDRNNDDHAIAGAVISLGHTLGMEISAEGVERPTQLDILRAMGCDVACGYLLARPQPPDRLTGVLGRAHSREGRRRATHPARAG
jgi:diguanylate cyclase (GGDEF)-like protein/PAS domain S-box-containing protein